MELFCFSVESSSVQVYFLWRWAGLGEQLAATVVLKAKEMTGDKVMQNMSNSLKKVTSHYICKSRRFSRKTGYGSRTMSFSEMGFEQVLRFQDHMVLHHDCAQSSAEQDWA